MTISTSEAARILVHYIKLALGEQVKGDMHAELGSVVDAFDALDAQLQSTKAFIDPRTPIRARR